MQRIIFIIAILFMLTSCVTQKRCDRKFPVQVITVQKDSILTVEVVRDSISYYTDSSYVKALLECDEHGRVIMSQLLEYKSGHNIDIPHVIIKDNVITASCNVDSMAVYNLIKSKLSTNIQANTKESIKEINVLTPFQKFRCKAFWLESLILLIILFIFIKKLLYGKK